MLRVALRSLRAHKRRLVSTVVAVVLGVSFMTGTLVLADTIDKTFDDLFAQLNEDVAAQVQGEKQFGSPFGDQARELLDIGLVDTVQDVDVVAAAEAYIQTPGFGTNNRLLDPEGEEMGSGNGPPTLLESWIEDEELNPYVLDAGRPPVRDDEVALNVAAVDDADIELGEIVTLFGTDGTKEYEVVGTFRFGRADSAGGAISADFTLSEAQRIAGIEDQTQTILVRADDGLSPEQTVTAIEPVLPEGAEVITGEEAAAQTSEQVTQFAQVFSQFLLIFASIALLVGIFIIYNTFSILIAQRTRELALLRTLGASRRQVLGSVILEAFLTGVIAAVAGLVAGVGLAVAATAILDAVGFDLPSSGLAIGSETIITALLTGVLVTVAAAVLPAIRATRVPPLAALRDVAIDRSGASKLRVVVGVLVLALGGWNLSLAWRADGDTDAIPTVVNGAFLLLVGAIVVGPVLAGPSVQLIGTPVRRLRGVTGRLSVENARRSPKRTSLTASALIIGVALIGFISVFGASVKDSVTQEVGRGFLADYGIQARGGGFGPPSAFSPRVAEQVDALESVSRTTSLGFVQAKLEYERTDGEAVNFVTAIDPETIEDLLAVRMEEGEASALTDDGVIVDTQIADDAGIDIGDVVTITGGGGKSRSFVIESISNDLSLLGFLTITRTSLADITNDPVDVQVLVEVADDVDLETARAEIEEITDTIPGLDVLDKDDFRNELLGQINVVLNLVQGLLLLSVFVAMIGIANTLSLSVQERTRELGLLRAVGMTRAQLRQTIRYEAILIALLGAGVGLTLGVVLSRAVLQSMRAFGFSEFTVPVASLVLYALVAVALAILSSLLPARRAARMDVLDAIATE